MKPLLFLAVTLLPTTTAMGWPSLLGDDPSRDAQTAGSPHPAVVRVIVPDGKVTSLGSGALVAVSENLGLVVTNWHVVQDARGQIVVAFPDGFRSGAALLATDRDWDLAALAIRRPRVDPIPLAARPPQPGEPLTIAGYGKGEYRAITGRCTQYVSPGQNYPFEMVELSAGAREGDSGGPILNSRGELAGVLFGAAWGHTAGSYCGRVRWFLNSVAEDFRRLEASSTMIAQTPPPGTSPAVRQPQARVTAIAGRPQPDWDPTAAGLPPDAERTGDPRPSRQLPVAAIPVLPSPLPESNSSAPPAVSFHPGSTVAPPQSGTDIPAALPEATELLRWEDIAGSTRSEQIKTVLAAIGLLAVVFHAMRLLAKG